jgi:predicted acyl esterase
MDLVGPMKVRLHVEVRGAADAHLFVAISKIDAGGRELPFEGSGGFGCDVVAKGWQRLAHRRLDESRGEPYRPYHPHDVPEPVRAGEIVPVEIEILPSATSFARGETLRLRIQGQWYWRRSMFFGMFPFAYAPSPEGKVVLHFGEGHDSHLLVPRA